jgi:hypothetical protein
MKLKNHYKSEFNSSFYFTFQLWNTNHCFSLVIIHLIMSYGTIRWCIVVCNTHIWINTTKHEIKLLENGIGHHFYNIIKSMYSQSKPCVRLNNTLTDFFGNYGTFVLVTFILGHQSLQYTFSLFNLFWSPCDVDDSKITSSA